MQSRNEVVPFDNHEWVCVSVQSPLGAVILARRLPAATLEPEESSKAVNRQFGPSNHRDSAAKRPRSRRSP